MSTGYIRIKRDGEHLRFLAVGIKHKVEIDITNQITQVEPATLPGGGVGFRVMLQEVRLPEDLQQQAQDFAERAPARDNQVDVRVMDMPEVREMLASFEQGMEDIQKQLGEAQAKLEAYVGLEQQLEAAKAQIAERAALDAVAPSPAEDPTTTEQDVRQPEAAPETPKVVEAPPPPRPQGKRRG